MQYNMDWFCVCVCGGGGGGGGGAGLAACVFGGGGLAGDTCEGIHYTFIRLVLAKKT